MYEFNKSESYSRSAISAKTREKEMKARQHLANLLNVNDANINPI